MKDFVWMIVIILFNGGSLGCSYCGFDWDWFLNGSIFDFDCNIDFGSGMGFNGDVICVESCVYGGVSVFVVLCDFDLSFYGNFGFVNYEGVNDYGWYVLEDFLREVIGGYW